MLNNDESEKISGIKMKWEIRKTINNEQHKKCVKLKKWDKCI